MPPGMATDVETTNVMNAHLAAADPHLQYLTQARADERYGLIKKILFYGTTAGSQGGSAVIAHGLIAAKIAAVNALIEHAPGGFVTQGHTMTAGYEISLSLNSTSIYVGNVASKSFNVLNKPVKIVLDYLIS